MKKLRDRFNCTVEMSGLSFEVKGWIDSDGRADIDDVTLDAKRGPDGFVIEPGCCQNMWPILYETEPGDTIQMEADDYLGRQRQNAESWDYDEIGEAA